MTDKSTKLFISFQDIQGTKKPALDPSKCYCLIAKDQDSAGRLRLTQSLELPITPRDSEIQIIVNSEDSDSPIGSIKFMLAAILPCLQPELSLWYSITMDTYDTYTGDFKEDQLTVPRIKLSIKHEGKQITAPIALQKEKLADEASEKLAAMDEEEKKSIEAMRKKLEEIQTVVAKSQEAVKNAVPDQTASQQVIELQNKIKGLEVELKNLQDAKSNVEKLNDTVSQKDATVVDLSTKEKALQGQIDSLNKLNDGVRAQNKDLTEKSTKAKEDADKAVEKLSTTKALAEKNLQIYNDKINEYKLKDDEQEKNIQLVKAQLSEKNNELALLKKAISDRDERINKFEALKQSLDNEKKDLTDKLEKKINEVDAMKLDKSKADKDISLSGTKLLNASQSWEDEKKVLLAQIAALTGDKKTLTEKEALLNKKVEDDANEISKIKREAQKSMDDLNAKIAAELEAGKKDSSKCTQMLNMIETQNKELKEKNAKSEKADNLSSAIAEFTKKLNEMMEQRSKCTVTIRVLSDKVQNQFEEIDRMENQIRKDALEMGKLNEKLKDTENELDKANKEKNQHKKDLDENRSLNEALTNSLNSAKIKIAEQDSTIKEKNLEIAGYKEKVAELKKEIDRLNKVIEAKDKEILALIKKMEENEKMYKKELAKRDQTIADLTDKLNDAIKKLADAEERNKMNLKMIENLKEELKNKNFTTTEEVPPLPSTEEVVYKADSGDLIDEEIARYMNKNKCPIMFRKIGEGMYMFGTKKVFAKIMNDRLVIRVGGGYMMIDQFLSTYTEPELKKLTELKAREAGQLSATAAGGSKPSPGKKLTSSTTFSSVMQQSMPLTDIIEDDKRPGVHSSFSKLNGTSRIKTLNENDLKNAKHSGSKKSLDGKSPQDK
jgi:chromosome segregation ATPase